MLSRQYTKKIRIDSIQLNADGYGGNTTSPVVLGSFWAEVKQLSSFRENQSGSGDMKNTYSFKVRANPAFSNQSDNLSILYKNQRYISSDITYDDENFRFVNIIAHG